MSIQLFNRLILNPQLFPYVRGQELPDPVGVGFTPPVYPADSRFMTQGWDRLNVVKAPPASPPS